MPLQVPQTPLPPKRGGREVRGPAYDMAAQATPSGRMWVFLLMERAAQCVCVIMCVAVESCIWIGNQSVMHVCC